MSSEWYCNLLRIFLSSFHIKLLLFYMSVQWPVCVYNNTLYNLQKLYTAGRQPCHNGGMDGGYSGECCGNATLLSITIIIVASPSTCSA